MASTCGTLLSSQGSDAHFTIPSRAWFGATVLTYSLCPSLSTRLIGVSPGRRGFPSYLSRRAIANQDPCDGGWLPRGVRGASSVPARLLRLRQQGRHYGLVTGHVKSLESRACRSHRPWYLACGASLDLLRYESSLTSPTVFLPRRSTIQPPAKASADVRRASASRTLVLFT